MKAASTAWTSRRYLLSGFFMLFESWALAALIGAVLWPMLSGRLSSDRIEEELILDGVRYLGGLGLYIGSQISVIRLFKLSQQKERALAWRRRFADFHLTVLGICALGALLGAVIFPLAGSLGGSLKTRDELIVLGARTGGFFFLVWAPGFALVRGFIRAARARARQDF